MDTEYGMKLTERFVDVRDNAHDAFVLMNRHNNKVGRQVGDFPNSLELNNSNSRPVVMRAKQSRIVLTTLQ